VVMMMARRALFVRAETQNGGGSSRNPSAIVIGARAQDRRVLLRHSLLQGRDVGTCGSSSDAWKRGKRARTRRAGMSHSRAAPSTRSRSWV